MNARELYPEEIDGAYRTTRLNSTGLLSYMLMPERKHYILPPHYGEAMMFYHAIPKGENRNISVSPKISVIVIKIYKECRR